MERMTDRRSDPLGWLDHPDDVDRSAQPDNRRKGARTMNDEHWFSSKLRDVDREECLRLLRSQQVGRIAFVDDSGPDVLPVNFTMDGDDLLVATTGYGALARGATGARVAFEVDGIDEFNEAGWSVVVRGRATRESTFGQSGARPHPWADGTRNYVLRIATDTIAGRRLIPS